MSAVLFTVFGENVIEQLKNVEGTKMTVLANVPVPDVSLPTVP